MLWLIQYSVISWQAMHSGGYCGAESFAAKVVNIFFIDEVEILNGKSVCLY
jgi:hypothetical protein